MWKLHHAVSWATGDVVNLFIINKFQYLMYHKANQLQTEWHWLEIHQTLWPLQSTILRSHSHVWCYCTRLSIVVAITELTSTVAMRHYGGPHDPHTQRYHPVLSKTHVSYPPSNRQMVTPNEIACTRDCTIRLFDLLSKKRKQHWNRGHSISVPEWLPCSWVFST